MSQPPDALTQEDIDALPDFEFEQVVDEAIYDRLCELNPWLPPKAKVLVDGCTLAISPGNTRYRLRLGLLLEVPEQPDGILPWRPRP